MSSTYDFPGTPSEMKALETTGEKSMLVKIYDRTPGGKTHLGTTKMDAIPRQGETCFVDEEAKVVHEVTWDLTKMEVEILLR